MFRSDYISTLLTGEVGWRQPTISGLPTISEANLVSRSSLRFEDAHYLCSIKNLYYTQENEAITSDQFNTLIANLQKQAIVRVMNDIFTNKSDMLATITMYPFESTKKEVFEKSGKFVGFRFNLVTSRRKAFMINNVRLSFDRAVTFTLYLFNSQVSAAVESKQVTTVANTDTIVDLGWVIAQATEKYSGGTFYLGYFEDDLGEASAYRREWELANCMITPWGMNINPVVLEPVTGTTIDNSTYKNSPECFGLNFDFSIYNDYTNTIASNRPLFAQAIQMCGGIAILETILNSVRSNQVERESRSLQPTAYAALYGSESVTKGKQIGLTDRYSNQIEAIRSSLFHQPFSTKITLR